MDNFVKIFISIVAVISMAIAVLLVILYVQRRRQRILLMLAIAQEQAQHHQRKHKKVGLHRWEIDLACPEALVSDISPSVSSVQLFSLNANPDQYNAALAKLFEKKLITRPQLNSSSSQEVVVEESLAVPAPAVLKDDFDSVSPTPTTEASIKATYDIPNCIIQIPQSMDSCVICLEEIILGTRVRSLPCYHVYHAHCIRVWLRRRNACPCCCVKVIKRRKKRERSAEPSATEAQQEPQAEHQAPVAQPPTSTGDVLPISVERVEDRNDHSIVQFAQSPPNQTNSHDDRPRMSSVTMKPAFPRNGSLLDPDDAGSEVLASEASSHLDESTATELLVQVRKALRGEGSAISLNEDSRSEVNEDSIQSTEGRRSNLDLDLGKRPGILAADIRND